MGDSDEEVQILRTDPGGRGVAGGDAVSAGARPPLAVGGSGSLRVNTIAQRSAVPKKARERPDVVLGEDDSLWSCSGVPAACAWPCHVAVKSDCGLGWSCASCNDNATVAGQGSSMADSVITADHPRRPSILEFCGKIVAVSRLPAGSRMRPVIRVMRSPAARHCGSRASTAVSADSSKPGMAPSSSPRCSGTCSRTQPRADGSTVSSDLL